MGVTVRDREQWTAVTCGSLRAKLSHHFTPISASSYKGQILQNNIAGHSYADACLDSKKRQFRNLVSGFLLDLDLWLIAGYSYAEAVLTRKRVNL